MKSFPLFHYACTQLGIYLVGFFQSSLFLEKLGLDCYGWLPSISRSRILRYAEYMVTTKTMRVVSPLIDVQI